MFRDYVRHVFVRSVNCKLISIIFILGCLYICGILYDILLLHGNRKDALTDNNLSGKNYINLNPDDGKSCEPYCNKWIPADDLRKTTDDSGNAIGLVKENVDAFKSHSEYDDPMHASNGTTKLYTLNEFKERSRTDEVLLGKILDQEYLLNNTKDVIRSYLFDRPHPFEYNNENPDQMKHNFSMFSDILVFLHIQKTGGSHLNMRFTRELQLPYNPCRTQCLIHGPCDCKTPKNSRWFYSVAFQNTNCGLHADWTQMHRCIPQLFAGDDDPPSQERRFFYFTQLRDAMERYLSEYYHQTSRGHWQRAILGCGDTPQANTIDVKPCFHGISWKGVTLDQFIECKDNLATNRMTRMLSDLTLANCYKNFTDKHTIKMRAQIWLKSAMTNLQTMEHIGLMEDESNSDKMFYKTYNLKFRRMLSPAKPIRHGASVKMTEEQFLKILQLTELDIHLYMFGKGLFYKRINDMNLPHPTTRLANDN